MTIVGCAAAGARRERRQPVADNKEIIERFERAFEAEDLETIEALCDPGFVDHNPLPGLPPTVEGYKQAIAGYKQAFPDLQLVELHVIADGDTVATRWTGAGTHQGELMGIPPTGKRIRVEGMNFYKLSNGRVTDLWTQYDGVGMLQQLGAMPAPEGAAA
jgi:steroid delta-isomerase-like uncharacterized protein